MKDIFKYTFLTVAEIKKFLFVIIVISILSVVQALPVISIISFILEKLLYLNIGVLLIYILKITSNDNEYFATLSKQPFSTFLLHFLPAAMGIMTGLFIIFTFFMSFFVIILKFTDSVFILADPHNFLYALSKTTFLAKILFGFYSVYLIFFSYIFLGKFGEALSKETFKESFLSIISSLIDFKFWINTFNLRYVFIYFVFYAVIITIYGTVIFAYLLYVFPMITHHINMTLVFIPILVAITTILTYFAFFSSYFAYKTTLN